MASANNQGFLFNRTRDTIKVRIQPFDLLQDQLGIAEKDLPLLCQFNPFAVFL